MTRLRRGWHRAGQNLNVRPQRSGHGQHARVQQRQAGGLVVGGHPQDEIDGSGHVLKNSQQLTRAGKIR